MWSMKGRTVAGGFGRGSALNQVNYPSGFDIDENGTLFVADIKNHRIMRWKRDDRQGKIIAGGKGRGNQTDQFDEPIAVLIDRINACLIISDRGNRRLMRWYLAKHKQNERGGEVVMSNISSLGLAMDNEGCFHVSDYEEHEVRRYGRDDPKEGVVVAGGNGQGDNLNQLHHPRHIFVDTDRSVCVSDRDNHRVIKWIKNATDGIVVAGGQGNGDGLGQLS